MSYCAIFLIYAQYFPISADYAESEENKVSTKVAWDESFPQLTSEDYNGKSVCGVMQSHMKNCNS